ncbi:MAG: type II secretion system protein [Gemmatimonadetes bacterium]|nr:MAG: type II secretion system protein [Gemmatimonadota bacterium]
MAKPKPRSSVRGFTLIELLIVTVVIAILASLVAPRLRVVREKAADAAALSSLHDLTTALELYFNERYEYPSDPALLVDYGWAPTEDVTVTTYKVETKSSPPSVHIHIEHRASTHFFHLKFPTDAQPEKRSKK